MKKLISSFPSLELGLILLLGTLLLPNCATTQQSTDKSTSMDVQHYTYPVHHLSLPNDIEIAYVDEGAGPQTLLFVHGLGSYAPAWQKNIAALRKHYRCIALDLPGYGQSSKGDYPFSMTFFAEQITTFIKTMNLKKVVLIGHSMGGQIAISSALQEPAILDKLVLVAPAGFETFTEAQQAWFQRFVTPEIIKGASPEQIAYNFALNFHGNQLPDDARFMYEDRIAMMDSVATYEAFTQMIPACVRAMLEEPVYDQLPQLTVPSLVLFGKEDALIPNRILHPDLTTAELAKDGQTRIPNSELQLLSPCGHFVQWDCPEAVNAAIRGFLEQ